MLAAGLSHHIRNSLVAVKTFMDLAPSKLQEENVNLDSLRNPDFWKDYYQNVQGQVEKINDLLKDLWLASEKAPFHFSDRILLHHFLAPIISKLKPAFDARNIGIQNDVADDVATPSGGPNPVRPPFRTVAQ